MLRSSIRAEKYVYSLFEKHWGIFSKPMLADVKFTF